MNEVILTDIIETITMVRYSILIVAGIMFLYGFITTILISKLFDIIKNHKTELELLKNDIISVNNNTKVLNSRTNRNRIKLNGK